MFVTDIYIWYFSNTQQSLCCRTL